MKLVSKRLAQLVLTLVLPAAFASAANAAEICIVGQVQYGDSKGCLGKSCAFGPADLCEPGQSLVMDTDKWIENFCWEYAAHNGDCAALLPHMRDYHGALTCQNQQCC